MTDIVERLRASNSAGMLCDEAAGEIERLRAALLNIRDEIIYGGGDMIEEPDIDKLHDIARKALEGRDDSTG